MTNLAARVGQMEVGGVGGVTTCADHHLKEEEGGGGYLL